MLVNFKVKNFGPYRDEASLSMTATKYTEHEENKMTCPSVEDGLLRSALIYGPNASGKSNLFTAISTLQNILKDSSVNGHYKPFMFNRRSSYEPTVFSIDLILDNVPYRYTLEYEDGCVLSESLYYSPNGRIGLVFTRGDEGYSFGRTVIKGQKTISEVTENHSPYLSVANMFKNKICMSVYEGIMNGITVIDEVRDIKTTVETIAHDDELKEDIMKSLKILDIDICSIECVEKENNTYDMCFGHTVEGVVFNVPIRLESEGIRGLVCILCPIISALKKGSVVMLDGLGSELRPEVSQWVLRQFSAENNPNRAQMIAISHDITLMDLKGLIRRDQIYFVQKDPVTGTSFLYGLSSINGVKKAGNLARRYLDGNYMAVPVISTESIM